ncbi:MAG: hypothetical protein JRI25_15765, partial [Deltaproteobacteria bacterium]|nr:hypothetical protein [Deltaproteobacteria bacterium]
LFERYHDRVQFLVVYIREAHPTDGWWLGGGVVGWGLRLVIPLTSTDTTDPATLEERRAEAGRCQAALELGIPTLVDDVDDRVNEAYAAWPTRLYLIDVDGHVAYAGGLGPFGFRPAALGRAIEAMLTDSPAGPR